MLLSIKTTLIRARATGIPGTIKEGVGREEEEAKIEAIEAAKDEAIQVIKGKNKLYNYRDKV